MTSFPALRTHYDAVIIGARPAGAATGLMLARSGARVLVVDKCAPGSDTLSTHALMRTAVVQLQRMDVLEAIVARGTPAVRQTTIRYGQEDVRIDISNRWGVDALYAPRRTVLDHVLADAARIAGAEVRHGVWLDALQHDGNGRVTGVWLRTADGQRASISAGIVIGADGRASTVAAQAGAAVQTRARHTCAAVFGYFAGLPNRGYRWSFRPGSHVGVVPTNDGMACVFACVPRVDYARVFGTEPAAGFLEVVAKHDLELLDGLHASRMEGGFRRFKGALGFLRQAHGPGWALVGDAGYFRDPITAHGISDALKDAELLAEAVLLGRPLSSYQARRDTMSRPLFDITDRIASFDWDLNTLKRHHRHLNRAMNDEMTALAGPAADLRPAA